MPTTSMMLRLTDSNRFRTPCVCSHFFEQCVGGIDLKGARDTPRNTPITKWLPAEALWTLADRSTGLYSWGRALMRWTLVDVSGGPRMSSDGSRAGFEVKRRSLN
jgi:hypothetical protein